MGAATCLMGGPWLFVTISTSQDFLLKWIVGGDLHLCYTVYEIDRSTTERGLFNLIKKDNNVIVSRLTEYLYQKRGMIGSAISNFYREEWNIVSAISNFYRELTMIVWEQNKSYFKFENWWLSTEGFVDRKKKKSCGRFFGCKASLILF